MTRNDFLANWLSNASTATGFSAFVSIIALVLDNKVTNDNQMAFVVITLVLALFSIVFFAMGLFLPKGGDQFKTTTTIIHNHSLAYQSEHTRHLNDLLDDRQYVTKAAPQRIRIAVDVS